MADTGGIDRDRLVADLTALVQIPSITGSEEAIATWAAEALGELGLAVYTVTPDPPAIRADPDWPGEEMPRTSLPVVVGRAGRADGRRVILSGHLDVVPPGDPATWTVDPWGAEIRDDALYGRGACDMKGGVAAILAAVRTLAASGDLARLDGELLVVLVPSEEDGGQGTLAAIRAGATGDLAIITEPSNLDVVVAHAGAITFRLTVPGRAAHASQRREGVSALDNLFVLSQALAADEARRNEAETDPLMTALGLPYPTIIGIVEGGEWASTVLDRITADGRYGVRLGQTAAEAEEELRTAIAEACVGRSVPARPSSDGRDHRRSVRVGAGALRPPAAGRAGRDGRSRDGATPDPPRRAVRRRHADVRQRRFDAVRHLRPGRRPGRPQRRRACPVGRGRRLCAACWSPGSAGSSSARVEARQPVAGRAVSTSRRRLSINHAGTATRAAPSRPSAV